MAGRGHVDVNERRLRPVYDALDNLNNKQAIQLADKILKKQKDFHCAKALKALALLRSNRLSECLELQEELKKINTWDDSILQCMTMTYKEMQRPEEIAAIYELAVKQNQNHEEFLSHLFMAYVRIGNYLKQQKAAMNLHKVFPSKNPYYFWAVMSVYMQALMSDDEKAIKSMLLPLAERMVSKYVKDKKVDAEAEVQLYLMVLEKAGKYEEALSILKDESEGSIGKLVSEKEEMMAEYLQKLESLPEVNKKYKKLLLQRPDQWSYYSGYIDSAMQLVEGKWSPKDDDTENSITADHTLTSIKDFLNKQLEANESYRGPYLARIELLKRMSVNGTDCQEELFSQLVTYFDKFGSRNCCFNDIGQYVDVLDDAKITEFTKVIADKIEEVTEDAPLTEKIRALQRFICKECIERRLGCHEQMNSKERLEKAKELMKKHKECIDYGKDFPPTDVQPVDTLALLAAYLLIYTQEKQDSQETVWHALLILEEAVRHSPSNHEFKLIMLELYSSIGAFGPCMKLAEELEIKYIMLDTLGYKLTRFAQPLCHFQLAATFYSSTLKFFHANQKDTPEQIISAYRYGAFRKIPEIIEFKDRLNTSIQFSSVLFEKRHLDLLQQGNSIDDVRNVIKEANLLMSCPASATHFDGLLDNRDFTILNYYDIPSRQTTDEQKALSYAQEILWIRYRCLTLRMIGIAFEQIGQEKSVQLTNGAAEATKDGPAEDLEIVINQIEEIILRATEGVKAEKECASRYRLHSPPKSRWLPFIDGCFHEPTSLTAKLFQSVLVTEDKAKLAANVQKQIEDLLKWLKESFKNCKENLVLKTGEKETMNGSQLENVCLLVEISNYITIMLSLILEPLRGKFKRPKKKKAPQTQQGKAETLDTINNFMEDLSDNLEDLNERLVDVERNHVSKELEKSTLTDLFEMTQSDLVTNIWQKIQASYKQSIQEVTQIIELKIRFLHSMKS